MTRYEQGFLTKCAEHGLSADTAVFLMSKTASKMRLVDRSAKELYRVLYSKADGARAIAKRLGYTFDPSRYYSHVPSYNSLVLYGKDRAKRDFVKRLANEEYSGKTFDLSGLKKRFRAKRLDLTDRVGEHNLVPEEHLKGKLFDRLEDATSYRNKMDRLHGNVVNYGSPIHDYAPWTVREELGLP